MVGNSDQQILLCLDNKYLKKNVLFTVLHYSVLNTVHPLNILVSEFTASFQILMRIRSIAHTYQHH